MTTETTGTSTMTKGEQIKAKIAAAKAKAATANPGTTAPAAPATGKAAKLGGAAAKAKATKEAKVKDEPKVKAPKLLNLCGCGCHEACKNKFLPGHDARFHSVIKRIQDGRTALADPAVPAQVRDGMFPNVVQKADKEGNVIPVNPKVSEADYLESLKGQGGEATS